MELLDGATTEECSSVGNVIECMQYGVIARRGPMVGHTHATRLSSWYVSAPGARFAGADVRAQGHTSP